MIAITTQNLNAATEARTAAEKARETATGMLRYIELESQAVRHGDQFAAENAVCEAERDSEYTHELVNALTEIRQKKVSAEKP